MIKGDLPSARFGHTITPISKRKVVLFGGATGDAGNYTITAEAFVYDAPSFTWTKLNAIGNIPSARAAHGCAPLDQNQMLCYGGASGGGALASDDLFLLDLRMGEENGKWIITQVIGKTPGRRYGHSFLFWRPNCIIFGGSQNNELVNDIWCLNLEKTPLQWNQFEIAGSKPEARLYHSSSLCTIGAASGMIVIFGGRGKAGKAFNDIWGLRKHRDGTWDWVEAPYKTSAAPLARYQHTSLFLGPLLLIIGGRCNEGGENVPISIYDTETSEWNDIVNLSRFRHASWATETHLFVFGGFEHSKPSLPSADLSLKEIPTIFKDYPTLKAKLPEPTFQGGSPYGMREEIKEGGGDVNTGGNTPELLGMDMKGREHPEFREPMVPMSEGQGNNYNYTMANTQTHTQKKIRISSFDGSQKAYKLAPNVIVATGNIYKTKEDVPYSKIVKSVPLEKMSEESRRLGSSSKEVKVERQNKQVSYLTSVFIKELLKPKEWARMTGEMQNSLFMFQKEDILALSEECLNILREQSMVIHLKAPIKVFGDVHGQYQDLMRFFDLWGCPVGSDSPLSGDIESYDYLFLGDYVDRGSHSLETICLLMALKVRYPEQIHLLRGNHEDRWINNVFGFADECATRLGEDPNDQNSVFNAINDFFDWLPLAAIIEDKICCLHGGIGSSLKHISQLEILSRPLEVVHEVTNATQQLIVDILWSDPTDSDAETGIQSNLIRDPNGTGNIVKFGPDKVVEFLKENGLGLILRAHECVMDGFERFAGGALITVFSATDYCGRHKNAGAVLFINRMCEITPKLIYPLENQEEVNWFGEKQMGNRPPTPPRWCNPRFPQNNSFQ